MDKYQEALEFIKSDNVTAWGNENIDKMHECIEVLQESVDKETPKKVITKNKHMGYGTYEEQSYCSRCGANLTTEYGYAYCHRCGQALDWSDEDE